MAIDIELKIEKWKNKLLDLGKRNRLLNYKETKRSSLQILKPDFYSLWKTFVQDEKSFEFPYFDELSSDSFDEDSNLETNQTIREMQKTLRNLRDKAKTVNEEQGTNILYLSFGFLKWKEQINSNIFFNSPIILVPVNLTVESITSPYILSLHEDEIVLNPTLCQKLENDFGIILPSFNEDIDISCFLEDIRKIVANNQWEVNFNVSLSLLSFLKINMYNDLHRYKDKIKHNSILRTICGDVTAFEKIPEDIIDFDFDNNLKPTQVFQVVDADSSQQDAILCAKKGISFVLQGPPGTGKSQTITNIISECLADGKKILFVSEKMAALEVVHRRLTTTNLNDFCLILHSHKANKRNVLDELGCVLKMAENKVQLSEEAYQKLEALQSSKQKLNNYANQLFIKIAPLDKTIFEANSILAHLESYDDIIFSIENVEKINKELYNKQLYLLEQLSSTIGKMSEDYSINPWYGSILSTITNELRHDIGANLSKLIPKVSLAIQKIQQIYEETELQWKESYTSLELLIPIFDVAKLSPNIPISWIIETEVTPLFDDITKYEQRKLLFLKKQNELEVAYQTISKYENEISDLRENNLIDINVLKNEIEKVQLVLSKLPYSKWNLADTSLFSLFEEAKEKAKNIKDLQEIIILQFENTIFDIDFQDIYNRYKTKYTTIFKFFKKSYRNDKKTIQVHHKTIIKKITDQMVLDIVTKLRTISEIKKWFSDHKIELTNFLGSLYETEKTNFILIDNYFTVYRALNNANILLNDMFNIAESINQEEDYLKAQYQFLYKGIETDWEEIREALIWATNFKQQVEQYSLNLNFVKSVCSKPQIVKMCDKYSVEIQSILNDIDVEFQWFLSLFVETENIKSLSLSALQDKLEKCKNNLILLEEWIDFRSARDNCNNEGLKEYISKIEELHIHKDNFIPIFKKRFFRLWLDAVLPNYPAVLYFRRRIHESTISEFSELDKLQFNISKSIIRAKLINNLPQMNHFTSGFDEIGILKREMNKQRKIMPVRKLFKEIPNLLLTLKPCLMMSPLSVSLFLEADTYKFDTVIFDEASQICTENAIGTIFRGKQVIIAGDSKQLPPTNFFTTSTSEVEYDVDNEDDDSNAYESILDEANLLPERTLRWHYRSKHEHLIAFSNAKIYKNNLITFPSNIENVEDYGVEYLFVNEGFYDVGGKAGNVGEAKKVAELVFEHFRNQPNRSIGVIAFGKVQQEAIDTEIRSIRIKNQEYELFFKEEKHEPFFIKNLENVQGDERDTIILSIGYGKDSTGKMNMNFGPLSKFGGERRLNVAITRAKFNIKLVGSIIPTDIEVEKISYDGPKLLRGYIEFALEGNKSLLRATTESDFTLHDSPFEEAVYNFLDRKGYKLATQVGCSGYRIDMAVKHPTLSGIYVLGIECDGAAYHSSRTARERDRLRQDVLESMGWKIYRIWSTDWIKDTVTEGENLINAISDAISNYGIQNSQVSEKKTETDDFIKNNYRTIDAEHIINPYKFEKYIDTNFDNLPYNSYEDIEISDYVIEVVKNEYPIHYDLLCQKIAPLYGNQKATIKIRREVDLTISKLGNNIYRSGNFIYPSKDSKIIVKMPNNRNINHIAIEEIAEAMIKILKHCFGTNRNGLLTETRKVYGFKSSGQNISIALNSAFDLLINSSRIEIIDGKIVVCNKQ